MLSSKRDSVLTSTFFVLGTAAALKDIYIPHCLSSYIILLLAVYDTLLFLGPQGEQYNTAPNTLPLPEVTCTWLQIAFGLLDRCEYKEVKKLPGLENTHDGNLHARQGKV